MTATDLTAFHRTPAGYAAFQRDLRSAKVTPVQSDEVIARHFDLSVHDVQEFRAELVALAGLHTERAGRGAESIARGTGAAGHDGVRGVGPQALRFSAARPLSHADALSLLTDATGKQVTLVGVLGDRVSGVVRAVDRGMIVIDDKSNTTGLPRHWPIESLLEFDTGKGAVAVDVTEAGRLMREEWGVGLRRDHGEFYSHVRMALGLIGSAGGAARPKARDARDAFLRLVEEAAVHPRILQHVFLPEVRNWGTETARTLDRRLTPLVVELDETIRVAPKFIKDAAALDAAVAYARADFLGKAMAEVDEVLRMNVSINEWNASPEGRAFNAALDKHMLALGAAAMKSFNAWRSGSSG